MSAPCLTTSRLRLRQWRDDDLAPFAAMNADPRVMRYFPACLSREESDRRAAACRKRLAETPFGFWALERHDGEQFIGFTGLSVPGFKTHFTPCVEIGWRLAPAAWGQGFATEAARAALAYGFDVVGLPHIIAFTVPANTPSIRVMQRLGLTRWPEGDFQHPNIQEGHPLRAHIVYRAESGFLDTTPTTP
jgi:ribosomal-protein-alanine N-acetyltransferase